MTRWLVPKVISKREALDLSRSVKTSIDRTFRHDLILKIVNRLGDHIGVKFETKAPGYYRLESKPKGHTEHTDTGYKKGKPSDHMAWCEYGVSILLSPPELFKGGELEYTKENKQTITPQEHYLSAIVHTSNEYHLVNPHKGTRKVLLFFLKERVEK